MSDSRKRPLVAADVERLLAELQSIGIAPASAEVAVVDVARINGLAKAAADQHFDFFDNPAHFARALIEGGK